MENDEVFPHEEYLMKAMRETDFRLIGLVQDLGKLYLCEMTKDADKFEKALKISQILDKCAAEIAEVVTNKKEKNNGSFKSRT
jgi:hypothetical protein